MWSIDSSQSFQPALLTTTMCYNQPVSDFGIQILSKTQKDEQAPQVQFVKPTFLNELLEKVQTFARKNHAQGNSLYILHCYQLFADAILSFQDTADG